MSSLCRKILCILLVTALAAPLSVHAFAEEETEEAVSQRTETVYVDTDAEGNVTKVQSSVYLTNPGKESELSDAAELSDIKCLTQNTSPEKKDGVWVFQADGEDVSYQGTSEADRLPVTMRIVYELDGKTVTPAEIAGKSGHVRITVSYTNNCSETKKVNGKDVLLYTPFTVITMAELGEQFKHVTATNAKLMTDAGANTVFATTFPGLAASLDTEAKDNLSESFSFEADTDSFSLDSMTAILVPNLLSSDDVKDLDDLNDFVDGVDELNDAGEKLKKGAKSLYNGLSSYVDGMMSFGEAVGETAYGAEQIRSGVASVDTSGLNSAISSAADAAGDAVTDISAAIGTITGTLDPEQLDAISGALSKLESAARSAGTAEGILKRIPGIDLSELKEGTSELAHGLGEVENAARKLVSSADKLRKGAYSLYKGLKKFCNDGLKELDEQTGDLSVTADRKDAILELGEAYAGYSSDTVTDGSVKFMFSTEEIRPAEEKVPEGTEGIWKDDSEPGQEERQEESIQQKAGAVLDRFADFFRGLFGR